MKMTKKYSFKEYLMIIFCIFASNFFKLYKNLSTFVHPTQNMNTNFREKRKSLMVPNRNIREGSQAAALTRVVTMQEGIGQIGDGHRFQEGFDLLVQDVPDLFA